MMWSVRRASGIDNCNGACGVVLLATALILSAWLGLPTALVAHTEDVTVAVPDTPFVKVDTVARQRPPAILIGPSVGRGSVWAINFAYITRLSRRWELGFGGAFAPSVERGVTESLIGRLGLVANARVVQWCGSGQAEMLATIEVAVAEVSRPYSNLDQDAPPEYGTSPVPGNVVSTCISAGASLRLSASRRWMLTLGGFLEYVSAFRTPFSPAARLSIGLALSDGW